MESGETLDSDSLFQIATEASNEHLQYDESSGMYFDKEKDMYYDPASEIYYDYKNGTYYRIGLRLKFLRIVLVVIFCYYSHENLWFLG